MVYYHIYKSILKLGYKVKHLIAPFNILIMQICVCISLATVSNTFMYSNFVAFAMCIQVLDKKWRNNFRQGEIVAWSRISTKPLSF
jgi:hypothetical protein